MGEEIAKWDRSVCVLYYSRAGCAPEFDNVIIVFLCIAAGIREVIDVKVYGRYDEPDNLIVVSISDRILCVSSPSIGLPKRDSHDRDGLSKSLLQASMSQLSNLSVIPTMFARLLQPPRLAIYATNPP